VARPFLLVTAFEPFGPPGRPPRPENASETVLRAFGNGPGRDHRLVVLPVDPRAEVVLARALQEGPAGVIGTGEAGLSGAWDTNLEVRAYDRPVVAARSAGTAAPAPFLFSDFAAGVPLVPGLEREDRIGSYWCNRVYFRLLRWCLTLGRPGAFLHFRVEGDRARQAAHLAHVAARLEAALAGASAGAGSSLAFDGEAEEDG
jgi:hypothetical protein